MVLPTIEVLIKCWFSVYRDVRLRKREKFSIFYVGWDAWQLLAWDTVPSSVIQVGDTEWAELERGMDQPKSCNWRQSAIWKGKYSWFISCSGFSMAEKYSLNQYM